MAHVKPIPPGHTTVTPTITVSDGRKAIEFYKKSLDATERARFEGPDKKLMHAEIQIGNAIVMLNDEVMGNRSPQSLGGSPVTFYVYVEDVDAAFKKAIAAGGQTLMPVTDMFWGDRMGQFEDPFGYRWNVATRVKEMSPEEVKKAGDEFMKKQMAGAH
ncbi:MAG TPA: VOC family protein [Candidatus Eisenbacteria bacterium]